LAIEVSVVVGCNASEEPRRCRIVPKKDFQQLCHLKLLRSTIASQRQMGKAHRVSKRRGRQGLDVQAGSRSPDTPRVREAQFDR
jgi:hypothetical protein